MVNCVTFITSGIVFFLVFHLGTYFFVFHSGRVTITAVCALNLLQPFLQFQCCASSNDWLFPQWYWELRKKDMDEEISSSQVGITSFFFLRRENWGTSELRIIWQIGFPAIKPMFLKSGTWGSRDIAILLCRHCVGTVETAVAILYPVFWLGG